MRWEKKTFQQPTNYRRQLKTYTHNRKGKRIPEYWTESRAVDIQGWNKNLTTKQKIYIFWNLKPTLVKFHLWMKCRATSLAARPCTAADKSRHGMRGTVALSMLSWKGKKRNKNHWPWCAGTQSFSSRRQVTGATQPDKINQRNSLECNCCYSNNIPSNGLSSWTQSFLIKLL